MVDSTCAIAVGFSDNSAVVVESLRRRGYERRRGYDRRQGYCRRRGHCKCSGDGCAAVSAGVTHLKET